jgi:hypothetical protein
MHILHARLIAAAGAIFLSTLFAGCGDDGKSNDTAEKNPTGGAPGGQFFPGMNTGLPDAAGGPPGPAQPGGAPSLNPGAGVPGVPQPPIAATQDNTGRKGRDYGGGIITQPIASYFRIQDRVKLDVLAYDLKLYQAEHGHYPKSEEEFQSAILEPGMRTMPEAEDPDYVVRYSPETGWLILVPKDGAQ